MSKLTTYTVTFGTDRDFASQDIAAASPEAALATARAIADDRDRLDSLHFEPYSDGVLVNEILIDTPGGERVAEWSSPELLVRLAAPDLFAALQRAVTALNTARRFKVPTLDTDSYAIAAEGQQVLARACDKRPP
jgi:hypothetical protein